jgi:Tol biopolymer transport system component
MGGRIAFVSDREGNREVYVMDANGKECAQSHPAGNEDWTPAWSHPMASALPLPPSVTAIGRSM